MNQIRYLINCSIFKLSGNVLCFSHHQHQGANYIVGSAGPHQPHHHQHPHQPHQPSYNFTRDARTGAFNKVKKPEHNNMSSNYETNPVGALQVSYVKTESCQIDSLNNE